jgi:drug/metabolite transporter (DMT)-like permease
MAPWIAVTVAAAAVQTLRFALQKRLKGLGLSTGGATFARFLFGAPLALAGLAALVLVGGHRLDWPVPAFWAFVVAGGAAQIVATYCTVALFSERSFAVGIAFTKTETLQAAIFSALLLAEPVSGAGLAAIVLGVAGVLLLSRPPGGWQGGGLFNRATLLGLTAGALFAISAVGYRGATLTVDDPSALFRAMLALAAVSTLQTIAMRVWLDRSAPGEAATVLGAWRATALVGLTGFLGSLGWFLALALMNAAYVRSLGQIELLFSLAASVLWFRERVSWREIAGIGLLAASIIGVVSAA